MLPFFTTFVAFALILTAVIASSRKKQQSQETEFWERERNANLTPKQDITNLSYITIPLDKFPLDSCTEEADIQEIETLQRLSETKILNLVGQTNTDLKEAYGPQNLATLQECGNRFDELETALLHLGDSRILQEDYKNALIFLEYAAAIKSDISTVYTRLGDCYAALGQHHKIQDLMQLVPGANLVLENKVLHHLEELLPPELRPLEDFSTEESSDM